MVHGPQRPFACLLCDHAATKMDALAAHVRKHLFLYVCFVCDGKFVSSQRLTGHLKESHAELDQEPAFTNCINSSFYLMQPGGGIWGNNEDREDTEETVKEKCRIEQEGEDERKREEVTRNGAGGEEWRDGEGEQLGVAMSQDIGEQAKSQAESAEEVHATEGATAKEGELEKGGAQLLSQEVVHQAISLETQENTLPANEDTFAAKNTHTFSSSGNANSCDSGVHTHLSSAPPMEDGQTPQSERVNSLQELQEDNDVR